MGLFLYLYKSGSAGDPAAALIAIRVSGAALFLITVMVIKRESLPRDLRTWCMLLGQSIVNSIAAWTLLAWGQQFTDAGLASVLNSTTPIFVFLITLFVTRHEAVSFTKLLGCALGLGGVCLIVGYEALDGIGRSVIGQIACLLGAVLYGIAAINGKRFTHISPTVTATGTMIWASIVLVPAAIAIDAPWQLSPGAPAIGAALCLAVLCTGVKYTITISINCRL